jgi:hypothetical protein
LPSHPLISIVCQESIYGTRATTTQSNQSANYRSIDPWPSWRHCDVTIFPHWPMTFLTSLWRHDFPSLTRWRQTHMQMTLIMQMSAPPTPKGHSVQMVSKW